MHDHAWCGGELGARHACLALSARVRGKSGGDGLTILDVEVEHGGKAWRFPHGTCAHHTRGRRRWSAADRQRQQCTRGGDGRTAHSDTDTGTGTGTGIGTRAGTGTRKETSQHTVSTRSAHGATATHVQDRHKPRGTDQSLLQHRHAKGASTPAVSNLMACMHVYQRGGAAAPLASSRHQPRRSGETSRRVRASTAAGDRMFCHLISHKIQNCPALALSGQQHTQGWQAVRGPCSCAAYP